MTQSITLMTHAQQITTQLPSGYPQSHPFSEKCAFCHLDYIIFHKWQSNLNLEI